jgi:hypothetical protein
MGLRKDKAWKIMPISKFPFRSAHLQTRSHSIPPNPNDSQKMLLKFVSERNFLNFGRRKQGREVMREMRMW